MNKELLAVIAGAVVLFAAAIGASLAFIGGDDSPDTPMHTMPGGETMTGMTHTP